MIGKTILHYQILESLGSGGMGQIYKAQDTKLNRLVAIKVLAEQSSDADGRRRFVQEAQAASSLNHPNIITIHDIVTEGDNQYMVMEYVKGKTLADIIPPDGLSIPTALHYAVQIADGLEAAHAAGIVHRDLKPGNIMVTSQGLVKILDFGLAKLSFPAGPVSLSDVTRSVVPASMTVEGSILGTVSYMSPEQAQGAKIDARSDIFSFGCVLYEMVTGRRAFAGESSLLTLTAILRDEPRLVNELTPGVPSELAQVIQRALRKNPGQRWQSMQEMHVELDRLKQRSDSATLNVTRRTAGKPEGSKFTMSRLVAGLCVLFLAVAVGLGWWMKHSTSKSWYAGAAATKPNPNAPPKPSALSPQILTNQAVLDMVKNHVPDDVIIGQIHASQSNFNLSYQEVIRLSQGGVSAAVIQAMRDPTGAKAAAQNRTVQVPDSVPFEITLAESVPVDCRPGEALHFRAAKNVSIGDTVVVAMGAAVNGVIVEGAKKKFLIHTSRPTFRLENVAAVDGSMLKVRATVVESKKAPALEPAGGLKSKDEAAPVGSRFTAYFDGDQTVSVKPPTH